MTPERPIYWQIENTWIFYTLAALTVGLLIVGVAAHLRVWLKSAPGSRTDFSAQALGQALLDVFLGRTAFKGEPWAGLMHFLIFWGFVVLFIGTCLLAAHEYLSSFLIGRAHLLFEVAMEIGGLLLLAGIVWALVRRYLQRVPRLQRRLEDAVIPIGLLIVACSGFFLEGLRLALQKPAWAQWSFVGSWIADLIPEPAAQTVYPYLWWGHALVSLGFIALIPFSKLFHLVGGPAVLYLHRAPEIRKPAETEEAEMEESPSLAEAVFYDACMRCGRCIQSCPSHGAGEPLAPRDFVQAARHEQWQEHCLRGDIRFLTPEPVLEEKTAWYCTTCAACREICPVYGVPFKLITRQRTRLIEEGKEVPDLMNQTLERLFNYENPWVSSKRERAAWAKGLEIPVLKADGKVSPLCYFVGCTTSFDARAQGIARAFTGILQKTGVRFGIIGDQEPCCGDIARVAGETGLFQEKMENALELFDRLGIRELVTSSPHCFHSFYHEYPGRTFGVRHYTQVLKDLIAARRLIFKKSGNLTVTYHDPCYLGRHNRFFEEPREILRAIPGLKLVEMAHCGPNSLCCGGGGGRMWQGSELRGEARMSEIRMKEARDTGAEILITACPLCLIMLEDAWKTLGLEGKMKVMDLNEVVLEALD
ncbi:MAG: respiratory nitrate reductase subunit gamma [Deltaproteobacteria bacterium]|nr:respiratory nitrate reductase subunit gamma [Deltaproteobacteria bacterium]